MAKSWRTTVAGVATFGGILCSLLAAHFDGDPETVAQWSLLVPAIAALVGGIAARDNGVTSKSAGAE